ncbi:MAG: phage integrase N-terminal SAM-like domain-containing protein [Verrucomicrobiota bacterium]|nr:phage integrase N-terminal SAM-like domain-containing protein [Verrucomicrobiota bacterium]
MRTAIRFRHYRIRTEEAYVHWIRGFIFFTGKTIRANSVIVKSASNHLALDANVAAATRNQALSALLFLYREVLKRELAWVDGSRATHLLQAGYDICLLRFPAQSGLRASRLSPATLRLGGTVQQLLGHKRAQLRRAQ